MPASLQGVFHSIPIAVSVFSLTASPIIALVTLIVGPWIRPEADQRLLPLESVTVLSRSPHSPDNLGAVSCGSLQLRIIKGV
jgi:hypothetical protein